MNVRIRDQSTKTEMTLRVENLIMKSDFAPKGNFILERETGIKDKNGRSVFEGDTIRCEHDSCIQGKTCVTEAVVFWNETLSSFMLFTKFGVFLSRCWNIEVIEGKDE